MHDLQSPPGPEANGGWTDEQLANLAADLYFELQHVTFEEVAAAARHCRHLVPTSAGLPALRHVMRRRALGMPSSGPPFVAPLQTQSA